MQGLIFIKTDAWLQSSIGKSLLAPLAQPIESIWRPAASSTGLDIGNIKELAIGLYPAEPMDGQISFIDSP